MLTVVVLLLLLILLLLLLFLLLPLLPFFLHFFSLSLPLSNSPVSLLKSQMDQMETGLGPEPCAGPEGVRLLIL